MSAVKVTMRIASVCAGLLLGMQALYASQAVADEVIPPDQILKQTSDEVIAVLKDTGQELAVNLPSASAVFLCEVGEMLRYQASSEEENSMATSNLVNSLMTHWGRDDYPRDILQTISTDHLRAFWNDPYVMARIAAIHALGDVWAMGATPQALLSQITLPRMAEKLQAQWLAEILRATSRGP